MNSKLGLDSKKVAYARQLAAGVAADVQNFVDGYTTVAVERTLCRLLGIDGVDANSVPLPNVVVDSLKAAGVLSEGAQRGRPVLRGQRHGRSRPDSDGDCRAHICRNIRYFQTRN